MMKSLKDFQEDLSTQLKQENYESALSHPFLAM